jgi:hypothetical protein
MLYQSQVRLFPPLPSDSKLMFAQGINLCRDSRAIRYLSSTKNISRSRENKEADLALRVPIRLLVRTETEEHDLSYAYGHISKSQCTMYDVI